MDIPECDNIEDDYDRYLCIQEVAIQEQNPEICEEIPENIYWKYSCFSFVASAKKDWHICEKIHDKDYNDACLCDVAKVTEDKSLCNKLSDFKRDHCNICTDNPDMLIK